MKIVKSIILERSAVTLLARIKSAEGEYLAPADVSSISASVWDQEEGQQIGTTITIDPAAVLYDSLQTDGRWTIDSLGFCFALGISGGFFPQGERVYQVEVLFRPVVGDVFRCRFDLETRNIFGMGS